MATQSEEHKKTVERLEKEVKEVNDKVFQLQPYKQDITTTTAHLEYSAVCESVKTWVDRHLDPVLNDKRYFRNICTVVEHDPELFVPLRELMRQTDFIAMTFKNADTHIVVAIVMRFL